MMGQKRAQTATRETIERRGKGGLGLRQVEQGQGSVRFVKERKKKIKKGTNHRKNFKVKRADYNFWKNRKWKRSGRTKKRKERKG